MKIGFYDLPKQELYGVTEAKGMTPDDLRLFSLHMQLEAQAAGTEMDAIMVGWQPDTDYIGVFLLGSMVEQGLPETVLNRIEQVARGQ